MNTQLNHVTIVYSYMQVLQCKGLHNAVDSDTFIELPEASQQCRITFEVEGIKLLD